MRRPLKLAVLGRADPTGLGAMTDDFCRAMDPELVLIVEYNSRGPTDHGLIPKSIVLPPTELRFSEFWADMLDGFDALVGFETFYEPAVMDGARMAGCKTVLFPMWECTQPWCDAADVMVCLSPADERKYPQGVSMRWAADRTRFTPRKVAWPPHLIQHNAGTLGLNDRNGTKQVLAAAKYLEGTGCALLIRSQEKLNPDWHSPHAYYAGPVDVREDLWQDVDLFVFPLQIPGLALPLVEAGSCQIPTVITDIEERSDHPIAYRAPVAQHHTKNIGHNKVTYHVADVEALGTMLRAIAKGEVPKRTPPSPPTWEQFAARWRREVEPRITSGL